MGPGGSHYFLHVQKDFKWYALKCDLHRTNLPGTLIGAEIRTKDTMQGRDADKVVMGKLIWITGSASEQHVADMIVIQCMLRTLHISL